MKFYEVQQALEKGKKIKSKKFGTLFLKDGCLCYEHKTLIECIHGVATYVLFADDWEIIEDIEYIPSIRLFPSYKLRFVCPRCREEYEQIVNSVDKPEDIHECQHCGQKFKFRNVNEMKNMYYGEGE